MSERRTHRVIRNRTALRTPAAAGSGMRGKGLVVCLLALAAFAAGPAFAWKDYTGSRIAVAPVSYARYLPAPDRSQLAKMQEKLAARIRGDGRLAVIPQDTVAEVAGAGSTDCAGGCFSLDCLLRLGTLTGADIVLALELVSAKLSDPVAYELRLVSVAERRVIQRGGGTVRTEQVPVRAVSRAAGLMLDRLLNPHATLTIDTIPLESTVLVNGEPVGFAPLTLELASGIRDTVVAIRQGYNPRRETVSLEPGERKNLVLRMERKEFRHERAFPPVHAYAVAGKPLDQVSSNLDSRLSWGAGESYGARLDAGSVWRIGVGFFVYDSELDDVDADVLADAQAVANADAFATVIHSNLFYYPGGELVSPYVGLGVTALQRNVRQNFASEAEERSTDFEAGWMFLFGIETRVYGPLRLHVELAHTRALVSGDGWRRDEDAPERASLWERSFEEFGSFTVLRAGLGFTF